MSLRTSQGSGNLLPLSLGTCFPGVWELGAGKQLPGPLGSSQGQVPRGSGKLSLCVFLHNFWVALCTPGEFPGASSQTPRNLGLESKFPDPWELAPQGSGNLLHTGLGTCFTRVWELASPDPWEVSGASSQGSGNLPLGSSFPRPARHHHHQQHYPRCTHPIYCRAGSVSSAQNADQH